jgi:hypothetical protein
LFFKVLKPEKLDNDDSTSQDVDIIDDSNLNQFRSIENVINKVIRVLSNLAISQENGLIIIRRDDCIDLLFKILSKVFTFIYQKETNSFYFYL